MRNIDLIRELSKLPGDMEIEVFDNIYKTNRQIKNVYTGNERYMPGGRRNQPDRIFIEIE